MRASSRASRRSAPEARPACAARRCGRRTRRSRCAFCSTSRIVTPSSRRAATGSRRPGRRCAARGPATARRASAAAARRAARGRSRAAAARRRRACRPAIGRPGAGPGSARASRSTSAATASRSLRGPRRGAGSPRPSASRRCGGPRHERDAAADDARSGASPSEARRSSSIAPAAGRRGRRSRRACVVLPAPFGPSDGRPISPCVDVERRCPAPPRCARSAPARPLTFEHQPRPGPEVGGAGRPRRAAPLRRAVRDRRAVVEHLDAVARRRMTTRMSCSISSSADAELVADRARASSTQRRRSRASLRPAAGSSSSR